MARYTSAPDKRVLVALIRDPKDLERAKSEHWYRMPVHRAPNIRADYLALYQGANFGPAGRRIEYYARIESYRVMKRREILPEEPDHPRADMDYYKLDLSRLRLLPHPILNSTSRRVLFLFTTLDRLLRAYDVNYLRGTQSIEQLMWDELKRNYINASPQHYILQDERPIYRLDFAILCKNGRIDIECDGRAWHSSYEAQLEDRKRDNYLVAQGWSVLRFAGRDIYRDVKSCVEVVKRTIAALGGEL